MRKFAGLLVAARSLSRPGSSRLLRRARSQARLVRTLTGAATLKPGLSNTAAKNKPVITIKNAKLGGCTGGVTSGLLSATLKFGTANNCVGLAQGKSSNISGTSKVVWNNNTTSTLALKAGRCHRQAPSSRSRAPSPSATSRARTPRDQRVQDPPPSGQCSTKPLTSPTFKQVTKIVI